MGFPQIDHLQQARGDDALDRDDESERRDDDPRPVQGHVARGVVFRHARPDEHGGAGTDHHAGQEQHRLREDVVQHLAAKASPTCPRASQRKNLVGDDRGAQEREPDGPRQQADHEPIDHPLFDTPVLEVELDWRRGQRGANHQAQRESQREEPRRPIEQHRLQNRLREAHSVFDDAQLALADAFGVRHRLLDDPQPLHDRAGAHGWREIEPVGQRREARQGVASEHPHAARRVADGVSAQEPKEGRKQTVADAPHERHAAFGAHAPAEREVSLVDLNRLAQGSEERRVAGAVGIQEPHKGAVAHAEPLFDGRAIPSILLEHDQPHVVVAIRVLAGDLGGPVSGSIADHDDLDARQTALGTNGAGRCQAPGNRVADGLLLVEGGNDDRQ